MRASEFALDDNVDMFRALRRMITRKWTMLLFTVAGLLGAILYLRSAVPSYTVEMRVTPAPSSASGGQAGGGLGALASLAGVALTPSGGATPFELYLDKLTSRDVAARLADDEGLMRVVFADQWDEESRRWHEPRALRYTFARSFKTLLGLPVRPWRKPDAGELQSILENWVDASDPTEGRITSLTVQHSDPAFAARLLSRMNAAADQLVRRNALARASANAEYLALRMRTVSLAEHRETLASALGEQERMVMMASSHVPYAAIVVQGPTSSAGPTWPNYTLILLGGMLGGALMGAIFVLTDFRSIAYRLRHDSNSNDAPNASGSS